MKYLILCFDGTWNAPEIAESHNECPTNVLHISRSLLKSRRNARGRVDFQIQDYISGIGTRNKFEELLGGALGWGIENNLQHGYEFLTNNYEPGDRIFLFGFSRGAYTARALSGLTALFGILEPALMHEFPIAYRYYRTHPDERAAIKLSPGLQELVRQSHELETRIRAGSIPAEMQDQSGAGDEDLPRQPSTGGFRVLPLHFVGVWDTVGSLGAPTPLLRPLTRSWVGFYDTALAWNVSHAYHALALHELRVDFPPALWTEKYPHQVVEQVWFPGAHSDVGGGLVPASLSSTPLAWMVQKAQAQGLGFDHAYLNAHLFPDPTLDVSRSREGLFAYHAPVLRPMGNALCEFVHDSALERLERPILYYGTYPKDEQYWRLADERSLGLPREAAARLKKDELATEITRGAAAVFALSEESRGFAASAASHAASAGNYVSRVQTNIGNSIRSGIDAAISANREATREAANASAAERIAEDANRQARAALTTAARSSSSMKAMASARDSVARARDASNEASRTASQANARADIARSKATRAALIVQAGTVRSGRDVLDRAAAVMEALSSFHFQIDSPKGGAEINLRAQVGSRRFEETHMWNAEGEYGGRCNFSIRVATMKTLSVRILGCTAWIDTGKTWERGQADASRLIDLLTSVPKLLRAVQTANEAKPDSHRDGTSYWVKGTLSSNMLTAFANARRDESLSAAARIGVEDALLHRLEVKGRIFEKVDSLSELYFNFTCFDELPDWEPPEEGARDEG